MIKSSILFGAIAGSLILIAPVLASETTITGANGKTTSVNTQRSVIDKNYSVNRTVTYPNGKNSSSSGSFTNNGDGNYTGTVDRTNRQGKESSYQVEGQITKNTNSLQNTGTITNSNGKQATFNNSGSCNQGTCNGDRTLTYPNGQTRNTTLSGQRLGNGTYTGTATFTNRKGNSRTSSFIRHR